MAEGPTLDEITADLAAEQAALDEVVAPLRVEQWRLPTASARWTIADQIGHLAYFDARAAEAVTDREAFRASVAAIVAVRGRPADADALTLHRHLAPAELLEAWRANRRRLAAAAATLDESARVDWYGPSMGAKSFLTARLMECWAHGTDVADALGVHRPATGRLRHIARLGYLTRAWSYVNRGLAAPTVEVRLELHGPDGERWTFGPERGTGVEVVTGPALDFCLVVTQRRHVADTAVRAGGPASADWLGKAQAFAGPPTDGPPAA